MYTESTPFEDSNYLFSTRGGSDMIDHSNNAQMMTPEMPQGKQFGSGFSVPSNVDNMATMRNAELSLPMDHHSHHALRSPTMKHMGTVPLTPTVNISPNAQMLHFQTPSSTLSPNSLTPSVTHFSPLSSANKSSMFNPISNQDMSNMNNINFSHNFVARDNMYFDVPEKNRIVPPVTGTIGDSIFRPGHINEYQQAHRNTHNGNIQGSETKHYHSDETEDETKFPKENVLEESPDQIELTADDVLNDDPFQYSSEFQSRAKDDSIIGMTDRSHFSSDVSFSEADFNGGPPYGLNIRMNQGSVNDMNGLQAAAELTSINTNNRGKLSKRKSSSQLPRIPKKTLRKAKSFNESIPFASSNLFNSQASPSSRNNSDSKEPRFSMSECSSTFAITKSNNYSFVMENDINSKTKRKPSPKLEKSILKRPNSIACFDNEFSGSRQKNSPKVLKNMQSGMVLFQLQLNNNK